GTCPLPRSRGEQGTHPGIGRERAAEPGEVLSDEAVKERAGARRSRHRAGRAVAAGCSHLPVVRVRAVIAVSGNPPTSAAPARDRRRWKCSNGGGAVGLRMLGYGLLAA